MRALSFDNIKGNFFSKNTKRNRARDSAYSDPYTTTLLSDLFTKKLHIYVLILPSTIKMRQNLIFNVKVIEDSNRGFGLFRKGILKSKRPTGMSLCCLFTSATGYQAPPPIFIDGRMGWMGWMVGQLFFFCPYLENYYIFFFNCFSSLTYMDLKYF